jgi:hypothetical protein
MFSQFVFAKGIGTTMFQILQLPTNACDAALAGTSSVGDYSALSNPSMIPFLSRSLSLSHVVYIENMRYSVADINVPLNDKSGINLSLCYFDSGKMDRTIENGESYTFDGEFNATDKIANLSYGTRLGNSFSVGLSLKFIEQKIDDISYSSFLVGVSGLYFVSDFVYFALGINDFGSDVKGYSMPTDLYCSLTGNLNDTTIGVIQVDNYYNDDLCELKLAVEKKVDNFSMRFGYVVPNKDYNGTNNSFATNLTLGLGLNITNFFIDYAWLPKGDLGNVHMFTVRVKF